MSRMLLRPSNFFIYFSIFEKEYICNICSQKVDNRIIHIRFCHNEIYTNFKNLKYQKRGFKMKYRECSKCHDVYDKRTMYHNIFRQEYICNDCYMDD